MSVTKSANRYALLREIAYVFGDKPLNTSTISVRRWRCGMLNKYDMFVL